MPKRAAPTWEKSPAELVNFFGELAPKGQEIEHRKMFGYPALFLDGNLFAGLHKQTLLFRLSEADLAAFLKLEGAGPFEPMPGRAMKGYAIWSRPLERDPKQIAHWMGRSLEFARSLLAKDKSASVKGRKPRK